MTKHVFCTDLAIERGEPMEGTAIAMARVLLLAVPRGQWREARTAAGLSPVIEAAQAYAYAKNTHALLMDKVEDRQTLPQLIAYPEAQVLNGVDEQTLAAAMRRWADGGEIGGRRDERITILVCTDSRTDACCARYGFTTYKALVAEADPQKFNIVQTIHLGGCRFATSIAVLPSSERYGRLTPEQVPAFLEAIGRGETYLPASKGRIGLDEPAQVAELAARRFVVKAGGRDAAVTLSASAPTEAGLRFEAAIDGLRLAVDLESREFLRHGHCDAVGEPAELVERWIVRGVRELA